MTDKIHRVPRLWSNRELRKFAPIFKGMSIVNVSAWRDEDKEGGTYRNYFSGASEYSVTNFDADKRGFQGGDGEIFLNLEKSLPSELQSRFDVVFNHTTLEHVYEFRTAFRNLCDMSKDVVIVVVPFLQQMHADYGDYWRFTPQALHRMFEDEGFEVAHLSFNNDFQSSVYVFCIATKNPDQWRSHFSFSPNYADASFSHLPEPFAGSNAVHSNWRTALQGWLISRRAKRAR
ncbi:hypothetical protein [Filomicrobium sp.]|uniref:hypothetical protein n=1 Tax=Filomicrobium sp. TaxID=2024831 RepID=UPI00258E92AA|nr:hypothetical protein [Filomicrobium sp.]MCV0371472.1 hypothetical protein [Filomicrobium sp.]